MEYILSNLVLIIGFVIALVLLAAVFAPLESLGWWAGWSGKKTTPEELLQVKNIVPPPPPELIKRYYVVYLSGIGVATADGLAPDEIDFINMLTEEMPEAEIITEVFPYSVVNNPLTGQRFFAPIWKKVRAMQEKNPNSIVAMLMINIRNFMQVFVSADPRYGPMYSIGVAEEIARVLVKHNYPLGTDKPIFLIGFSGGGQVSIGAAPYLSPIIGGPVYVITVGGFLSDDPGIQQVKHLTHQYGDNDPLQAMATVLWSGRWPIMLQSPWNQMFARGRITLKSLGPMAHNGKGGYYDIHALLPNGQSHCAYTVQQIRSEIIKEGAA